MILGSFSVGYFREWAADGLGDRRSAAAARAQRAAPPTAASGIAQQPCLLVHKPNNLWCIDFKGWFRAAGGKLVCLPLPVQLSHSRTTLAQREHRNIDVRTVLFKGRLWGY
jgi:hypothetical protein